MPFQAYDILAMHEHNKERAVAYCLSVATNFPNLRDQYMMLADTIRHRG